MILLVGFLTCKTVSQIEDNLYCVVFDVKPCSVSVQINRCASVGEYHTGTGVAYRGAMTKC